MCAVLMIMYLSYAQVQFVSQSQTQQHIIGRSVYSFSLVSGASQVGVGVFTHAQMTRTYQAEGQSRPSPLIRCKWSVLVTPSPKSPSKLFPPVSLLWLSCSKHVFKPFEHIPLLFDLKFGPLINLHKKKTIDTCFDSATCLACILPEPGKDLRCYSNRSNRSNLIKFCQNVYFYWFL